MRLRAASSQGQNIQPGPLTIVVVAIIMLLCGMVLGLSIQRGQMGLKIAVMERNLEQYYCPDAVAKFIGTRPMSDKMRPIVRGKVK